MKISKTKKFIQIRKEIKKANNILLLAHRTPDGDAISSMLALNLYLKKQRKKTYIYALGVPKFLNFLPGFNKIQTRIKKTNFDLIFALDYAGEERLGIPPKFFLDPERVITIDHHLHLSGKKIGKIKLIDSKASSVSEILYLFFKFLKMKIDKDLATVLLTGILTDTVGFSRTNQKFQKIEEIIADLILSGGQLFKVMAIYQHLDFDRAKVLIKILERAEKDEEMSLIHSYLLLSDFGERKLSLSEPPVFPDFLSQIGEAKVYIFLIEQKNKIKVSLRSHNGINVAKIAEKFNGGGHKSAAGFKAEGTIDEVLEKVKKELKKEIK